MFKPDTLKTKKEITDALLDELSFHLRKVEELKSKLSLNLIDKSDTENREEQMINQHITQLDVNNPVLLEIKEEEKIINEIKSKMSVHS